VGAVLEAEIDRIIYFGYALTRDGIATVEESQ